MKFLVSFLGGTLVGAVSLGLIYPLYSTRIKLVTDVRGQYHGVLNCLLQTYFAHGLKGLYKGYSQSLMGIVVYNAIHFLCELKDVSDMTEAEQALYLQSARLLSTLISSPFEMMNRKKVLGSNCIPL